MVPDPETSTTPAPEAKKRRGLFGFLFKSALGCTAFAIGGLIGFVLLLPTLLAPIVRSAAPEAFSDAYRGQLEVAELDLGWFQPQTARGIVLRDPTGVEVARASAELPSLWTLVRSGGTRLGRIAVTLDAGLVADDAGVTNLERALAPKEARTKNTYEDDDEGTDPIERLAELDVELELSSSRLSWSDAETRRVGIPFEVRDLLATVRAHPGAPLLIHAGGKVIADSPGALEIDIQIGGPIVASRAWPFGKIDAQGRIEGFSSAMLDGLAHQQGNLREMLGPRFDLRFDASGVTPQTGELSLVFTSEKTSLSFTGRFADGALRTQGDSGLLATLPVPRGFLAQYVTPLVPAGAELAFGETSKPWTLRVSDLSLPIPPADARDLAALAPTLAKLACDVRIELPGSIGFENETTRAAGLATSVGDVVLTLEVAPAKPLRARVEAVLDTGTRGRLSADVLVADPWGPLAAGKLPGADVDVEISDVSTAAFDALAGRPGLLAEGIGPTLRIEVTAKNASLASGTIHLSAAAERLSFDGSVAIADGVLATSGERGFVLTLEPAAGWLEAQAKPYLPQGLELGIAPGKVEIVARNLSVPLPAGEAAAKKASSGTSKKEAPTDPLADLRGRTTLDLSCALPGIAVSSPETRAAKLPVALSNLVIEARLAREGRLDLGVRSALDTGTKGTLAIDASVADAWSLATPASATSAAKPLPPIDAHVVVDGLSTAGIDALAGQNGRIVGAIGPRITLTLDAKNASLASGDLSLDVEASALSVRFRGLIEPGVLKTRGPEELHIEAELDEAWLARELAAHLPAGGKIDLAGGQGRALTIDVRDLALPLPDHFGASGPSAKTPLDAAALIEKLALALVVRLEGLGYSDDALRAAQTSLTLAGLELAADLVPGKPLAVRLHSALDAGLDRRGTVDVALSVPELAGFVRDPSALPSVEGKVDVVGLPTEVLDVFAGKSGLVSKLLGPALDVHAQATAKGSDKAEFDATVQSPTSRARIAGRLEERTLVFEGDRGVDLEVRLPKAWVEEHVGTRLPAGARLSVPTETAPLVLRVRDTRIPLPASKAEASEAAGDLKSIAPKVAAPAKGAAEDAGAGATTDLSALLERFAALSMKLELVVPTLVYSDAATDAAGRPLSISELKTTIEIAPEKPPLARIEGRIDPDQPGAGGLVAEVRALDSLAKLGAPNGLDTFRVAIRVDASGVPVALVDALAKQDGLLVDALGKRADLDVTSESLSLAAGAFVADMRSDEHHKVHAEGRLEKRSVQIEKVDGLKAEINLGPLVSERIIGSLVPMLVRVEKPGGEPFLLALDDLSFPLDADLSKLDALVRLDLGTVSYELLPGLDSLVPNLKQKTTTLPPLKIPVEKGVARYDRLPIRIDGREYAFSGSYSLVDQTFHLGTSVPLAALGKKVSGELDKLRDYLSPDLAVPIEIRGTWRQPRIAVGKDFLRKIVEDAAENQLEGLLKDVFKKKKKN